MAEVINSISWIAGSYAAEMRLSPLEVVSETYE